MKNFSFVVLIAMALTLVACGNKNSSGGSKGFSSDPYTVQTVDGVIILNQGQQGMVYYTVQVGGVPYQLSSQSLQVIQYAVQQAASAQIPLINGNQLKAKITGSVQSQGSYQAGYQQPVSGQQILNVQQATVYR